MKDLASADELLAASLIARTIDNEVEQAARLVIEADDTLSGARDVAEIILGKKPRRVFESRFDKPIELRLEIARRKRLLRRYPRDTLLLTETALLYTNVGVNGSASNLLKQAVGIAPNDRYVLRSLTRFHVHEGRPDRAIHVLEKSSALRHDPWLLAAHIAVEDMAGKSPTYWKVARETLNNRTFSQFDLAELAAAVGTIHLDGGRHKIARKFFRTSLVAPTENAVAQAQWASRRDASIDTSQVRVPHAYEALTARHLELQHPSEAARCAGLWLDVEPFSSRPATTGSFIAVAFLGDGALAERFALRGLAANRGDSVLHNNLAVAYAIQGKIPEARAELENVKVSGNWSDHAVNLASRGLIEMRSGNAPAGLVLYEEAMKMALNHKSPSIWCRAAAHLVFELARFDKADFDEHRDAVISVYDKMDARHKAQAEDVPAILKRAEGTKSAAELVEQAISYRVNDGHRFFED